MDSRDSSAHALAFSTLPFDFLALWIRFSLAGLKLSTQSVLFQQDLQILDDMWGLLLQELWSLQLGLG
ncbi:MAG: hypothetical protein NVS2B14_10520 [Chamaesiphon sp.]